MFKQLESHGHVEKINKTWFNHFLMSPGWSQNVLSSVFLVSVTFSWTVIVDTQKLAQPMSSSKHHLELTLKHRPCWVIKVPSLSKTNLTFSIVWWSIRINRPSVIKTPQTIQRYRVKRAGHEDGRSIHWLVQRSRTSPNKNHKTLRKIKAKAWRPMLHNLQRRLLD